MAASASNPPDVMTWLDKLLLVAALAVAVGLFLSVGWMAIAPADPRGAVSLVTHDRPMIMIVQAAALAAVTAAIATVMVGTKLPDSGVFAAALGMALVSLRGDTAAYLLINVAAGDPARERALAAQLAVEAAIWFAVLVVAMVVSGLVLRWCFGSRADPGDQFTGGRLAVMYEMSVSRLPFVSRIAAGPAGERDTTDAGVAALRYLGVVTAVGMVLYALFVVGSSPRAIRHGQVCFAAFASFYVAVWIAKSWFGARTPFWGTLAVPIACILGYLWSMIQGDASAPYASLASVPPSRFLRALPITFVAVGALGALAAHWTVSNPVVKPVRSKPAKRASRR
jgi:hypothetical protein